MRANTEGGSPVEAASFSDSQLVTLGQDVCRDLNNGFTFYDAASDEQGNFPSSVTFSQQERLRA